MLSPAVMSTLVKRFFSKDELENTKVDLEFSLIDIDKLADLEVYPVNAKEMMKDYSTEIKHFIFKEE